MTLGRADRYELGYDSGYRDGVVTTIIAAFVLAVLGWITGTGVAAIRVWVGL